MCNSAKLSNGEGPRYNLIPTTIPAVPHLPAKCKLYTFVDLQKGQPAMRGSDRKGARRGGHWLRLRSGRRGYLTTCTVRYLPGMLVIDGPVDRWVFLRRRAPEMVSGWVNMASGAFVAWREYFKASTVLYFARMYTLYTYASIRFVYWLPRSARPLSARVTSHSLMMPDTEHQ